MCVNLVIDAYDESNYDFTKNVMIENDDEESDMVNVLDEGGIAWLIRQQGYSVEDFNKEFNADGKWSNKLFESISNELSCLTYSIGLLTVSFKMTVKDLLDIKYNLENNRLESITLDKKCDLGLVDYWNGCGSALEIQLEKDLVIPANFIYNIDMDENFHYNIQSIYALNGNCYWNDVNYSTKEVALA